MSCRLQGGLGCRSASTSLGFTLVDVLVAILVLSFGVLGAVGMQAAGLQANREARIQATASYLAREFTEMVRGNNGVGILANNPYLGDHTSSLTYATPTYCLSAGASACADSTAVARAEMTEWLARVATQLPGAKVMVCFDTQPIDAGGTPQWACDGNGDIMVVKLGWTRASTDGSAVGVNALDRATIPGIVLPVTAGSNIAYLAPGS